MAYDKVVDSVKLDGAIKSTANTIRSKTGKSDKITWDESVGFSDAIKTQNKSVTPKASSQTIKPDAGYIGLGQVTVNGDADLKAANIAKGVNIFGVTGTLESGGKIATGEFTPSNYSGLAIKDKSVTISGLGFKPTRVIFYSLEQTSNQAAVYMCDSIGRCVSAYEGYDEDSDSYDIYVGGDTECPTVTFTSDGFKVSATTYGEYAQLYWAYGGYAYVAIG